MSDCAYGINGDTCMPVVVFTKICREHNIEVSDLKKAKKELFDRFNLTKESDIWQRRIVSSLEPVEQLSLRKSYYKLPGKYTSHALSNDQIDDILDQQEIQHPEFCNLHISLLDFMNYGGALKQLIDKYSVLLKDNQYVEFKLPETYKTKEVKSKKTKYASVVNSDVLGGRGKHWTCIFIDLDSERPTIEFFNSSGRPPYNEILQWYTEMSKSFAQNTEKPVEFVDVTKIRHQQGPNECGMYCLYYILNRLKNKMNYRHFKHTPISDDEVTMFRRDLFIEN